MHFGPSPDGQSPTRIASYASRPSSATQGAGSAIAGLQGVQSGAVINGLCTRLAGVAQTSDSALGVKSGRAAKRERRTDFTLLGPITAAALHSANGAPAMPTPRGQALGAVAIWCPAGATLRAGVALARPPITGRLRLIGRATQGCVATDLQVFRTG